VTGYGFISSHLVTYLLGRGAQVTVVEKNLLANGTIPSPQIRFKNADLRYFKDEKEYDYVFHLAGITNAAYAESNPIEAYEANVLATCNLLHSVKVKERFVFTSSATVYGNAPGEHILSETNPTSPISIYGATKVAAEDLIKTFARTRHLPFNIVRFFNLYGPKQSTLYIVPQIVIQALREKRIVLRNAVVERDFLFVGDAVECLVKAATSDTVGSTINVGSGIPISLGQLASTVLDVLNDPEVPVTSGNDYEPFSAKRLVADITRAILLGWKPKTSLREGLERTVPYYRKEVGALPMTTN
jgi:UDP-glucose 4-epimerase